MKVERETKKKLRRVALKIRGEKTAQETTGFSCVPIAIFQWQVGQGFQDSVSMDAPRYPCWVFDQKKPNERRRIGKMICYLQPYLEG